MADVKISQLPAATTPVDGTEVLPIVQSATTKQVSIANLTAGRAMAASSLTLTTPLAVTSGGTGLSTTAAGTLLSSTALNTVSATATPTLGVQQTTQGSLTLANTAAGAWPVTLQSSNSATAAWTMTLPTAPAAANGYILTSTTTGVTSWTNPTALGVDLDVGTTAITGGTPTRVLYNNAGVLGEYAVTGTGSVVLGTTPTFTTSALFPAGSVSAPSIAASGDTNTGVYFPAADNVAIATGGTAALTVDSNQNVSITGVIDGLSTPGTATGTGSTSGGTLAAATYYVRIVAFDSAGNTTNAGTESTGVTTTGSTSSIAYTWTAVTGATGYRVYFSTTSGTYASGYFVTTSASYTLTTTSGSIAVGLPANNTTGISLMPNQSFKRNRIINGDMRVAQRGTAAVTTNASYPVDRFFISQNSSSSWSSQQSTTAPTDFTNSLLFTQTTGQAVSAGNITSINQRIEGFNVADLNWGTASAKTVTLSFWVRCSLTGTFGVSFTNGAYNRSYVAFYVINSANTWEYKTVTVAGDTTGTWPTDNSRSININWDLGVGTTFSNAAGSWAAGDYEGLTGGVKLAATTGATFYITGVQLEVGSVATPYERQIYSDQLAQCQRYLPAIAMVANSYYPVFSGANTATSQGYVGAMLPVEARIAPTGFSLNAGTIYFSTASGNIATGTVSFWLATTRWIGLNLSGGSGLVAGNAQLLQASATATVLFPTGCEL